MKKIIILLILFVLSINADRITTNETVADTELSKYVNSMSEKQKSHLCYMFLGISVENCDSQDGDDYTKYYIDNIMHDGIKGVTFKNRALLCEINTLKVYNNEKTSKIKLQGVVDLKFNSALIYGEQEDKSIHRKEKEFFSYIFEHKNECLLDENIFYENDKNQKLSIGY